MSFSQITLIGRVGRNPEIRHTTDGSVVANFSVAVNDRYTTRGGEKKEETHWYQVSAWQSGNGGLVDIVSRHVVAGTQVMVQGRPILRTYEDKNGVTQRAFEVRLSGPSAQLRLLGGTRPPREPDADAPPAGETKAQGATPPAKTNGTRPNGRKPPPAAASDDFGGDVPF